jgi:hypothetical protein
MNDDMAPCCEETTWEYEEILERLETENKDLKRLVLTAPSYLGARKELHNHWLDEAEKVVGSDIYGDHDL